MIIVCAYSPNFILAKSFCHNDSLGKKYPGLNFSLFYIFWPPNGWKVMSQKAHSQCKRKRMGADIIQMWVQIPPLLLKKKSAPLLWYHIVVRWSWEMHVEPSARHLEDSYWKLPPPPLPSQLSSNPVAAHAYHNVFIHTGSLLKCWNGGSHKYGPLHPLLQLIREFVFHDDRNDGYCTGWHDRPFQGWDFTFKILIKSSCLLLCCWRLGKKQGENHLLPRYKGALTARAAGIPSKAQTAWSSQYSVPCPHLSQDRTCSSIVLSICSTEQKPVRSQVKHGSEPLPLSSLLANGP